MEGQVMRADKADTRVVAERVCAEITRFGFEGVVRDSTVYFLNNRNILAQMFRFYRSSQLVDEGEFTIDVASIRYRLSLTNGVLLYTTILALPLALAIVLQSLVGVLAVAVLWSINIGLGYLVLAIRIRRALTRVTSRSDEKFLSAARL
jgi:hypothetical protein